MCCEKEQTVRSCNRNTYCRNQRCRSCKKKLSAWSKHVRMHNMSRCAKCGTVKNLTAHHIQSKHDFPELAFDVRNGISLCLSCHNTLHGQERAQARTMAKEIRKKDYGRQVKSNNLQEIRAYYTRVCCSL